MILPELVEVPIVAKEEHGPVPRVPHGLAVEDAAHRLQGRPAAAHPASHVELHRLHPCLDAVLVLKAVLHHLQLQLAHRRQDRIAFAGIGVVEHLHRPLLPQLIDALAEAFEGRGVGVAQPREDLRAEAGNALVFHSWAEVEGVADREHAGVVEADHITRVGVLHHLAVLAEQLLWPRQADGPAAAGVLHGHVLLEMAGADAHEGDPVAVARVHVGLQLEHEAAEPRPQRIHRALAADAGRGPLGELQKGIEEGPHPEVGHR